MHKHKCKSCGFIWKHKNKFKKDLLGIKNHLKNIKEHSCPNCFLLQFTKYIGVQRTTKIGEIINEFTN